MATQDDYIKTALRLPRDLHARLLEASCDSGKSLNAEIIARLAASFDIPATNEAMSDMLAALKSMHNDVRAIRNATAAPVKKQQK